MNDKSSIAPVLYKLFIFLSKACSAFPSVATKTVLVLLLFNPAKRYFWSFNSSERRCLQRFLIVTKQQQQQQQQQQQPGVACLS
jgi:hypothetical protein